MPMSRTGFLFALGVPLCFSLSACSSDDAPPLPPSTALVVVAGVPQPGTAVTRTPVTIDEAPVALSVLDGAVAVGTATGLRRGTLTGDGALSKVAVVAAPGEPNATGAVRWMARRGEQGLLVAAAQGVFHDRSGALLPSPARETLAGREILSVDVFGEGANEELWIATSQGPLHVRSGALASFSVSGAGANPDAVVGVGADRALVTAGGAVYLVDVGAVQVERLGDGVGRALGFDRGDDGTLYVATEHGLLTRTKMGRVELRTFAEAGQPGALVRAVTAAYGGVYALVGDSLVQIDGDAARIVGTAAGAAPAQGIAVDSNGDLWATAGGALARHATGRPVSFARDVKPFFDRHCGSCHETGSGGAPVHHFGDYEIAKAKSAVIVQRLKAQGAPPMPPTNVEILTSRDYSVVVRWVAGGMQP